VPDCPTSQCKDACTLRHLDYPRNIPIKEGYRLSLQKSCYKSGPEHASPCGACYNGPNPTWASRPIEDVGRGDIHYRNRVLCRVSKTFGKCYFTLGKAFAECNTRQRFHRQSLLCRVLFSDTRQRLCRVSKSTRQRKTLGKLRIEKIKKTAKHFF
jgi:hypothetical protein